MGCGSSATTVPHLTEKDFGFQNGGLPGGNDPGGHHHPRLEQRVINVYPTRRKASQPRRRSVNKREILNENGLQQARENSAEKNGVFSPYLNFRRPIPRVPLWTFFQRYIQVTVQVEGDDHEWIFDPSSGVRIKYSEIESASRRLGSALYKLGFRPRSTLLTLTSNPTLLYYMTFAVWRLNGIIATLSSEDSPENIQKRLEETSALFLLCDGSTESSVAQVIQGKEITSVLLLSFGKLKSPDLESKSIEELLEDDGGTFPDDSLIPVDVMEDVIFIPHTSGPSGISRGAQHTHNTLISFFMQGGVFRKHSGHFSLIPDRSSSISGFLWPLISLTFGKSVIVLENPTPTLALQVIRDYQVTLLFGYPSYLVSLSKGIEDQGGVCSSVESCVSCSAGFPQDAITRLKIGFPNVTSIDVIYITTETLSPISSIPPLALQDDPDLQIDLTKKETIGRLLPYSMAKVIDVDTGVVLGTNRSGELCFKTMSMLKGWAGSLEEDPLRDGWFHSGDFGFYDENGLFFITARVSEVFKSLNEHVSPMEIEKIILQHPNVADCAVVGIPDEQKVDNTLACAAIVRRDNSTVSAREIRLFVDSRVPSYMQLRGGVIFLKELPHSKTGKISRRDVLRFIQNGKTI